MICKIIGTVLLLTVGGYVSFSLWHFERRRLRVLDGYLALLFYIRGQIDSCSMPLDTILRRADGEILADCLGFSRSQRASPAGRAHISDVRAYPSLTALIGKSRSYLNASSLRLLRDFSREAGQSFRGEQLSRCTYCIDALTGERQKMYESLASRSRTDMTLTACVSLAAVILLW